MKKLIIIISIIAVFLVGGLFLSRQLAQRQISALMADLETEAIQQGVLSSAVEATGTARANQSAYLIWKTAGKVDQVFVQAGDWVSTGEMIATLDPGSLPSFVILAQADLVNTQKQLEDLLTSSVQQASARKTVERRYVAEPTIIAIIDIATSTSIRVKPFLLFRIISCPACCCCRLLLLSKTCPEDSEKKP